MQAVAMRACAITRAGSLVRGACWATHRATAGAGASAVTRTAVRLGVAHASAAVPPTGAHTPASAGYHSWTVHSGVQGTGASAVSAAVTRDGAVAVGAAAAAAAHRRSVHTSAGVSASAKAKAKGKKKSKGRQPDKMYYTRVELPSHQAYVNEEGVWHTFEEGVDEAAVIAANSGSAWTPEARRIGAITLKCGMTADWDTWGQRHPLTVLKLEDVHVTQVKAEEKHGFTAVQVGGGEAKPKNVTQALAGHFAAAGVAPKVALAEFPVSPPDAAPAPGTALDVRHFVPGQYVDVTAVSIGKGFQGPMKRWNFGGQKASHGTSKAHRSHGSTGSSQNPGRVFKGKKMAGRMGGKRVTVECLQVYKVDVKRGLLYLRGAVPGHAGAYVRVRDSLRKPHNPESPPPYPTYVPTAKDVEQAEAWAANAYDTPAEVAEKRADGEPFNAEPAFELLMPPQAWDPFGIHDWDEPTMD